MGSGLGSNPLATNIPPLCTGTLLGGGRQVGVLTLWNRGVILEGSDCKTVVTLSDAGSISDAASHPEHGQRPLRSQTKGPTQSAKLHP